MIELDARLDNDGDHAGPNVGEAGRGEDRAMNVDRRARRLWRRDGKRAELLRSATGNRDLGADDIDRRLSSGAGMGADPAP